MGTIYLLHFEQPIGNAERGRVAMADHYTGYYDNPARIDYHRNGTSGVDIVKAFHDRQIPFVVARKRSGTKTDERRIKNAGGARRYCPVCSPRPRAGVWGPVENLAETSQKD